MTERRPESLISEV